MRDGQTNPAPGGTSTQHPSTRPPAHAAHLDHLLQQLRRGGPRLARLSLPLRQQAQLLHRRQHLPQRRVHEREAEAEVAALRLVGPVGVAHPHLHPLGAGHLEQLVAVWRHLLEPARTQVPRYKYNIPGATVEGRVSVLKREQETNEQLVRGASSTATAAATHCSMAVADLRGTRTMGWCRSRGTKYRLWLQIFKLPSTLHPEQPRAASAGGVGYASGAGGRCIRRALIPCHNQQPPPTSSAHVSSGRQCAP